MYVSLSSLCILYMYVYAIVSLLSAFTNSIESSVKTFTNENGMSRFMLDLPQTSWMVGLIFTKKCN